MPEARSPSLIVRAWRRFWWLLDAARRVVVTLLFFAVVAGAVWLWVASGPPALQPKTALVLDIAGEVTEQRSAGLRDQATRQLQDEPAQQTRLRDVLAVLDAAARDERIVHAVLVLDDFQGAGLATLREIGAAIERFKAAGKPVYAWGSSYDQRRYYLAAHASEVWLHPMGIAHVEGYGRWRNYYKDAFDRLGVSANVVRVGTFKNAFETFAASEPSPETREADALLYGALWSAYTAGVERARKLPPGSIAKVIDSLPASLQAAGGDAAKLALDARFVDALKTRDEMRAVLIEKGAKDDDGKTFRQVSLGRYLAHVKPRRDGDAVGIVVAEGEIGDGRAPAGRIGGLSTAELIRKARDDEKIKAIVLRVDSPGGSAFGSELVRRELELARAGGKPVVVSMGDVAASGGYWISLAADEIVAEETTITGSIGVVGMLPSAAGAMDKLSIRTGGHHTTWLAGAYDVRRPVEPRFVALVQSVIDHAYTRFTGLAAAARKTTAERIDAVGQGRVWTGAQARERGLVDRIGSFGDAIEAARRRARLPADARVEYVEVQAGPLQRMLDRFGGALAEGLGVRVELPAAAAALGLLPAPLASEIGEELAWVARVADRREPFAAVVHCLCVAP